MFERDSVDGRVLVSDLGSKKGTFVNGDRVIKQGLTLTDEVTFGSCTLVRRLTVQP